MFSVSSTRYFIQKKERKLKKGSGYHVDQLILGGITFLGGLLGMPWMCAAAVRTVAHISALTVYSRTHAPGEKPQLLGVKEQRVTNFCVHFLIGEIPPPPIFKGAVITGVSCTKQRSCLRLPFVLPIICATAL